MTALGRAHFKLRSEVLVVSRSLIREVAAEELKLRPRMGDPGEVVANGRDVVPLVEAGQQGSAAGSWPCEVRWKSHGWSAACA